MLRTHLLDVVARPLHEALGLGARACDELVGAAQRIALDRADAARFAANAVSFDGVIVMSSCSDVLRRTLADRGYTVAKTPLHAFLRSGGSACCLTLRLDFQSRTASAAADMPGRAAAGEAR